MTKLSILTVDTRPHAIHHDKESPPISTSSFEDVGSNSSILNIQEKDLLVRGRSPRDESQHYRSLMAPANTPVIVSNPLVRRTAHSRMHSGEIPPVGSSAPFAQATGPMTHAEKLQRALDALPKSTHANDQERRRSENRGRSLTRIRLRNTSEHRPRPEGPHQGLQSPDSGAHSRCSSTPQDVFPTEAIPPTP